MKSKDGRKTGNLEIDDAGNLYWDGKRVIIRNAVSLDWWVNLSVIIGSLSTLVMAIYAVLDFYRKT